MEVFLQFLKNKTFEIEIPAQTEFEHEPLSQSSFLAHESPGNFNLLQPPAMQASH